MMYLIMPKENNISILPLIPCAPQYYGNPTSLHVFCMIDIVVSILSNINNVKQQKHTAGLESWEKQNHTGCIFWPILMSADVRYSIDPSVELRAHHCPLLWQCVQMRKPCHTAVVVTVMGNTIRNTSNNVSVNACNVSESDGWNSKVMSWYGDCHPFHCMFWDPPGQTNEARAAVDSPANDTRQGTKQSDTLARCSVKVGQLD